MKSTVLFLYFITIFFTISGTLPALGNNYKTIKFKGNNGLVITADLYETGNKKAPFILLFHQAGSSRGEYRKIAPELVKMGYNCLAVDARSGAKDPWSGVENETAKSAAKLNLPSSYPDAYPDLEAALNWVKSNNYTGRILAWGSSYSATLVLRMAKEKPSMLSAVISYSPGEYYDDNPGVVSGWAREIKNLAVYIACGAGEKELSEPIFNSIPGENKTFYLPEKGRHGSSILLDDSRNWESIKKFLNKHQE